MPIVASALRWATGRDVIGASAALGLVTRISSVNVFLAGHNTREQLIADAAEVQVRRHPTENDRARGVLRLG